MHKRSKLQFTILIFFWVFSACTPSIQMAANAQPTVELPTVTVPPKPSIPAETPLPTSTPAPALHIRQSMVEVIATDAANKGDGGNSWGGHQSRIVHTMDGIFTAYTVEKSGPFHREWRLVQRKDEGVWELLASGDAGKDPVNLLAGPDGTLYLISWPNATGTLWQGRPENGSLILTSSKIPGVSQSEWPYASAGINAAGDLCILSSVGGETPGGKFMWSCYYPERSEWISNTTDLDYRYCYTYVFPGENGELSLVSTRDVLWSALGYTQPQDAFDYAFNAYGVWQTANTGSESLKRTYVIEEPQTEQFPFVQLNAQQDAYIDTRGRMHVIYRVESSPSVASRHAISRHAVLDGQGNLISDQPLPGDLAWEYSRIFQDGQERFYLLTSRGFLYPMDSEGIQLEEPLELNLGLGRDTVEYSGFSLSVPRTGTPRSDVMDVVFPSANGSAWMYFQLDFSDSTDSTNIMNEPLSVPPDLELTVEDFQIMLDSADVFYEMDLADPSYPGLSWFNVGPDTAQYQNGSLLLKGSPNGSQMFNSYGLRTNEACMVEVRFEDTAGFVFNAMTEDWSQPTGANWGIAGDAFVYYQEGKGDWVGSNAYKLAMKPGRWYEMMLWVKASETFVVRIWEKDNPAAFGERVLQMSERGDTWKDRRWHCHTYLDQGSMELAAYRELRFTRLPK